MKKNQIKGALYGFAVGDALGCTTEFMTESQVKQAYGTHRNIIGGGYLHWNKGDVTDDTDLMLCVGRAYMSNKMLDDFLEECAAQFSKWYTSNPKDIGTCCNSVMLHCCDKPFVEWKKYSKHRQDVSKWKDQGNGSLMRALVPALCNDSMFAVEQGTLTHNNVYCSNVINKYTEALNTYLNDDCVKVKVALHNPTGEIVDTYASALYAVINTDTFEEALIYTVNRGGDADTIGAIAGSLAGAKYGYDNIPVRWINALHKSTRKELDALADFIYAKLMSKTTYWEETDVIDFNTDDTEDMLVCSNCKCGFSKAALWKRNFCPNCGKPMKENNDG